VKYDWIRSYTKKVSRKFYADQVINNKFSSLADRINEHLSEIQHEYQCEFNPETNELNLPDCKLNYWIENHVLKITKTSEGSGFRDLNVLDLLTHYEVRGGKIQETFSSFDDAFEFALEKLLLQKDNR